MESIEDFRLFIEAGFRRIDVLGSISFEDATAEPDDPASIVADGEHQPLAERVIVAVAALARSTQTDVERLCGRDAVLVEVVEHRRPTPRSKT